MMALYVRAENVNSFSRKIADWVWFGLVTPVSKVGGTRETFFKLERF